MAAAGVIGLTVQRRASDRAPRPAPAPVGPQSVELPPHFEQHLEEKARLLDRDLQVDPEDAVLLIRQTETYLFLAVLNRGTHPAAAGTWIRRARATAIRIPDLPEAAQLQADVQSWKSLQWSPGASPTMATRNWSAGFGPALMGLKAAPDPNLTGGLKGPSAPSGPGGRMMGVERGPIGMLPRPQLPGPASGPRPEFAMPRIMPPRPDLPGQTERGERLRSDLAALNQQIRHLREAFTAAPAAPDAADALGRALETHAQKVRLSQPVVDPFGEEPDKQSLEEAAQVYTEAAARAPLLIHQAAFYSAAAAVYGRLQQPEAEYRALRLALDRAPYSATLWRRMQHAALQTGHPAENRLARRLALEWTFPGLRFQE